MNKMGQATYRANFSEDALLQDKNKEKGKDKRLSRLPAFNIKKKERDFRGMLKLTEEKLINFLKEGKKKYDAVIPTERRVVGDREKVAMIEMIIDNSSNYYITNSDRNVANVFMTSTAVIRIENQKYFYECCS